MSVLGELDRFKNLCLLMTKFQKRFIFLSYRGFRSLGRSFSLVGRCAAVAMAAAATSFVGYYCIYFKNAHTNTELRGEDNECDFCVLLFFFGCCIPCVVFRVCGAFGSAKRNFLFGGGDDDCANANVTCKTCKVFY